MTRQQDRRQDRLGTLVCDGTVDGRRARRTLLATGSHRDRLNQCQTLKLSMTVRVANVYV